MKVLVVDDSRVMRQIVVRTLRQAGFDGVEVVEAGDGEQGLAKVAECAPDLVLCDWNMPVVSGLEMLERLRASGDRTRFGFVTSEGAPAMRARAEDAGAAFVITKPFTPETFYDVISAALVPA